MSVPSGKLPEPLAHAARRSRGAAARDACVRARALAQALRAIATGANVRKGIDRIRRWEVGLLVASLRNLIAYRMAVSGIAVGREGPDERYTAEPRDPSAPLVSVVVPCVNHGRFVAEAVASALAQTFTDLEVVVVDGGSTDATTPDAIAALAGPRVRVFLRAGGPYLPGANRNFGIEHARGRYICCLDADDVLEPTYVEKLLFLLEHRGFHVASSAMRMFGAREGSWAPPARPDLTHAMAGNCALTAAVFRRSLWERVGGYVDTGRGRDHLPEDWDFWLRAAAAGARFVTVTGEALFAYRTHAEAGSMSTGPGVPPLSVQRAGLLARNRAILTREAMRRSRREAARRLRAAGETAMTQAMREADPGKPRRPTLLLAVPHLTIGGAERLLSEVAAGFVDAGWRVAVVSTEFDHPGSGDAADWFRRATPEVYALPRFLEPRDWGDFSGFLTETRRPDALIIAGSRLFYDLLPEFARKYPDMARLDLLFNNVGHADKHLEHRTSLTGALCENGEVHDWLRDVARWPDASVACVPSGVDITRFRPRPRPERLAARLGIEPGHIVVGWSGRLSEEKAPEVFLDLAARCRDLTHVRFVMTGGGRLAERIKALAASLPANTRLSVLGVVNDVAEVFALYDIYTLTSAVDGRPLAVMEALASGCAVLGSRIGGVPELVRDGATGRLVPPADPPAFEAALRAMLSDERRLRQMQAEAARDASERFSVSRMVNGYVGAVSAAVRHQRAAGQPGEASRSVPHA